MNFSLKSSFSAKALARQERCARTREFLRVPYCFQTFFFAKINNPKSLYLKKASYLALCLQPLNKNPLLWLCQPALSDLSTHLEEDKNQMAAPGRERGITALSDVTKSQFLKNVFLALGF